MAADRYTCDMSTSLFRRKPIGQAVREHEPGVGHAAPEGHPAGMHRTLGVRDLTFFGIAAIIGAGSFSSMGTACASRTCCATTKERGPWSTRSTA